MNKRSAQINIASLALSLQLQLRRAGAINLAAALFVTAGCIAVAFGLPHLEQQAHRNHAALAAAQKTLSSPPAPIAAAPVSQTAQNLQQFYDVLGESRYAEQQVKTLFALAAKNNLTLNQAEYKYGADKNGKFNTYAITLPAKASYAAIRPFCEQVLLSIPFASLDNIDLKRDTAGSAIVDAKLHFTLYLDNSANVSANTAINAQASAMAEVEQRGGAQ